MSNWKFEGMQHNDDRLITVSDTQWIIVTQGQVPPAPRPQVTRKGVYYKENPGPFRDLICTLTRGICLPGGAISSPWLVDIFVVLATKHRRDPDNMVKSVFDALTPHPLLDDSVIHVKGFTFDRIFSDRARGIIRLTCLYPGTFPKRVRHATFSKEGVKHYVSTT